MEGAGRPPPLEPQQRFANSPLALQRGEVARVHRADKRVVVHEREHHLIIIVVIIVVRRAVGMTAAADANNRRRRVA